MAGRGPADRPAIVLGRLARSQPISVVQRYRHPYNAKIEAVYVFPLPQDAAVSEFIMVIGERWIRGIIRERPEADRAGGADGVPGDGVRVERGAAGAHDAPKLLTQSR